MGSPGSLSAWDYAETELQPPLRWWRFVLCGKTVLRRDTGVISVIAAASVEEDQNMSGNIFLYRIE